MFLACSLKLPRSTPYVGGEHNQRLLPGLGRRRPRRLRSSPRVFRPRPLEEGFEMTRMSLLSSPLLLGFEDRERLIERVGKAERRRLSPLQHRAHRRLREQRS